MRGNVPAYSLRTPKSLSEALDLVSEGCKPLAGGTDLMVLFEAGKLEHRKLINIWGLGELRGIAVTPDSVTLGALTTYTDVLRHSGVSREFPLLAAAASLTGAVATQNRGTLGGNIVNASPAADSPPALLIYDAELDLVSPRGARWIPYRDFHTSYKRMRMEADELLRSIRLPRRAGQFDEVYRKVGTRKAQAISKVCFAALRDRGSGEVRIALGSVAPTPLRCVQTEAAIREGGDAVAALTSEIAPIDDMRSSQAYRLRVAQNLLREFLDGGR
ncbi:MAG: xanthine dehydrogenase family protein subunit M [Acidobacteriota bacterium]|nr:xanthine dehydrogenase family protein subunit M [Acidobacteriota bacterium]